MEHDVQRSLDALVSYFEAHRRQIDVSRSDSRIARTLRWLLDSQREDGSWGNEDVATTALAALAFESLSQPASEWELSPRVTTSLARAGSFLVKKYERNNWEEAVWDTAVGARALLAINPDKYSAFVRGRVSWLITSTESPGNYGPHHMAQAVLTLTACATHRDLIAHRCTALEVLLTTNLSKYSPYVLGQCLQALCTATPQSVMIPVIAVELKKYVASVRLDSGNFLNICQALQGLWIAPGKDNLEGARLGVASLFGNTCFRDTGSWYNSELMTSWALLTLARFSHEIVMIIPYSEATHELRQLRESFLLAFRRSIRAAKLSVGVQLLLSASWGALLASFITYSSTRPDLPGWSDELVGALGAALVGLSITKWIRMFRE